MAKSVTAKPISADFCKLSASPHWLAITAGIESPEPKRFFVIWGEEPITSATAIVSPRARPKSEHHGAGEAAFGVREGRRP